MLITTCSKQASRHAAPWQHQDAQWTCKQELHTLQCSSSGRGCRAAMADGQHKTGNRHAIHKAHLAAKRLHLVVVLMRQKQSRWTCCVCHVSGPSRCGAVTDAQGAPDCNLTCHVCVMACSTLCGAAPSADSRACATCTARPAGCAVAASAARPRSTPGQTHRQQQTGNDMLIV